jgi:ketosteroid isomerase-like protein
MAGGWHSGLGVASAQQINRVGVVNQFFTSLEAGDLDAAVATFSEDAIFVGGRSCTPPNQCYGRGGIASGLSGIAGNHLRFTLLQPQVAGSVVFGQYELRDDTTVAAGVDRILRTFLAEVPADRMTVFVSQNDLTDAQMAQYLGVIPASAQLDRRAILDSWFQARSVGDVDTAAAGFTEDAILMSAPPCGQETPCIGAAIRARLIVPAQDVNRRYTVLGSSVVIQYEQRGSVPAAAGIDRILVAAIVQMPQSQMNLFVRVPDLTDAQTASNAGEAPAPPN